MQIKDLLIRTKLRPPFTRTTLVPRPRLQEQVTQGLRGPLTLITAPAGFGKTTLLASCVVDTGHPVAWLSLDHDDNRDGRFLNYVIAALQAVDQRIGSEAAQFLAASDQVPPEAILTSLINNFDTTGIEISLVLDDYHVISNPVVHSALVFLIEHYPRTFHLVIASRSDPPLPLVRLRARGQMLELRAADLSFTESEAAQFLNDVMGLGLDASEIDLLEGRTEGWIAGLQMAALSMQDREDVHGFIEGFSGTNRHILDYLLEEVLARESQEVQDFLLQTAILTRLTGPLCDAVTGMSGGQAMLERLDKRNLFVVPLDDERRWYRYHHLFGDLLQARLRQAGPDVVAELYVRAAEWCEQNGQINGAVEYAFAAQDFERAGGLIARYWWADATSKGEIDTVWSWLNALSENIVRNNAMLSVAYCWVLWLRGKIGAIEAHLLDAERVAQHDPNLDNELYADLHAQLAALRSFVVRYRNEFETAIEFAKRALSLIPDHSPFHDDSHLRGLIFLSLASAYDGAGELENAADAYTETLHWNRLGASPAGVTGIAYRLTGLLRLLGRLQAADVVCRDSLDYIQAQSMARLPAVGILHVAMSEVLVERNALEAADAHLAKAMELGKWSGRLGAVRNAGYALSRLRQARGDLTGALVAIEEAEAALGEQASSLARAELLGFKTRVLLRQGHVSEAARCVEEAADLVGGDRGQTGQIVALAASRVWVAQGSSDEAINHLTESLAAAEDDRRLGAVIELYILRSLTLAQQGDMPAAESDLECALTIAEPESYMRVFLDEGQPMQMLIARWMAHAGSSPLRDYASHLLAQFETEQHRIAAAQAKASPNDRLIDPLSERELEVLHIMALGKTNKEIAQQLIVARGTIKAHTASIYRKLDVANRTEAVARARELGILP